MNKQRVFVGMSGGVDSSVTAALLKKSGHDVTGVFIRGWYPFDFVQGKPKLCTWREDRRDAMRVAAILDIPFYTFDFSKEYKKYIIDHMVKEYKAGRTPNPDVMCNKHIKFDMFLKKALEMGADKIATGHYVKMNEVQPHSLKIASDKEKDQSYFLWTLKQKQLKYCLFPIGDYFKSEVRELAKKFKLPVANKKDSQGLCFVGEFRMEDFLKDYIKPRPGKILNEKGEEVGEHKGVQYYTIGQRHGVGANEERPLYIVEKDLKKNILIVASEDNEEKYFKKEIKIKNVNWTLGREPNFDKTYSARIRYRQPLQKCKLIEGYRISFNESQRAVASGQSLVLYDGQKLLGGGVID
ncbi:MAG: tRNA 2-thiouridine(34) synthase MnmA [Patescibacteria group bacterium]